MAAAYGVSWWIQRPRFDFFEMVEPAGFRRLSLGAISGSNVFAGLEEQEMSVDDTPAEIVSVCDALYPLKGLDGDVPIAVFTDFNCTYCRVLDPEIQALNDAGGIALNWHELPLLGPASEAVARATLAAGEQGAYDDFHKRLVGGRFVPTDGFLRSMAQEIGLNGDQLVADQHSNTVDTKLAQTKALASLFGIPGTPSMVIGRTLVIGNISPRQIKALIEIERTDPGGPCALNA